LYRPQYSRRSVQKFDKTGDSQSNSHLKIVPIT